mgnify:CR=1 FL=1
MPTEEELDTIGQNLESGTEVEIIVSDTDSDVWGAKTVDTKTVDEVLPPTGDSGFNRTEWKVVWESGGRDTLAEIVEDRERIEAVRSGEQTDHYLTIPETDGGKSGALNGDEQKSHRGPVAASGGD